MGSAIEHAEGNVSEIDFRIESHFGRETRCLARTLITEQRRLGKLE